MYGHHTASIRFRFVEHYRYPSNPEETKQVIIRWKEKYFFGGRYNLALSHYAFDSNFNYARLKLSFKTTCVCRSFFSDFFFLLTKMNIIHVHLLQELTESLLEITEDNEFFQN